MWSWRPATRSSGGTCATQSAGPTSKTDPRSANNSQRVANREYVVEILSDVFLDKPNIEWLAILDEYDIPNAPVNDMEQVFTDPQVLARGMVGIYKHPTLGEIRYPTSPIKWSDWESPNESAPMLGQHTVEVLTGRLGLDESDVRSWLMSTWSRSGRQLEVHL